MHKLAYLYVFPSFLYFWINLVFIKKQKKSQNKQNPTTTKKPTPLSSARAAGVQKIWGAHRADGHCLGGSVCVSIAGMAGALSPEGSAGTCVLPCLPSPPTLILLRGKYIIIVFFTPGSALHNLLSDTLTGKPTSTEISCCLFSLPFWGSSWRQVFLWWKGYGFVVAHWESRDAAKMCTAGCRCPHPACIMHSGNAWTWQH